MTTVTHSGAAERLTGFDVSPHSPDSDGKNHSDESNAEHESCHFASVVVFSWRNQQQTLSFNRFFTTTNN